MRRHLTARAGRLIAIAACGSGLLACSPASDEVPGFAALERQVQGTRIGRTQDQWIEMRNLIGEWERTALIFGYADDYGECIKAIDGLKAVNFDREYRCVPAN